jgi:hypothetical protein
MKITNSLINIRAITAHFQPRIEAWLAAQQLSTPSEVLSTLFYVAGSVVHPDPDSMVSLDPYPDPDPGGKNLPTNIEKS